MDKIVNNKILSEQKSTLKTEIVLYDTSARNTVLTLVYTDWSRSLLTSAMIIAEVSNDDFCSDSI
jgi:hypothetical protein